MAAGLATLDELEAIGGIDRMRALGEMLRDGMLAQAHSHGIAVTWSGPPALPYMSFKADADNIYRATSFSAARQQARSLSTSASQLVPIGSAY